MEGRLSEHQRRLWNEKLMTTDTQKERREMSRDKREGNFDDDVRWETDERERVTFLQGKDDTVWKYVLVRSLESSTICLKVKCNLLRVGCLPRFASTKSIFKFTLTFYCISLVSSGVKTTRIVGKKISWNQAWKKCC